MINPTNNLASSGLETFGAEPTFVDPIPTFPQQLKDQPIWLVYKIQPPDKNGKTDKIPYSPVTHRKTNDIRKGVAFEVAVAAWEESKRNDPDNCYTGLGIYVGLGGLCVIDLDGCVDLQKGVFESYALEIKNELNSFTELSQSKKGLHIYVFGTKPGSRCRKNDGKFPIECYSQKRFIAVTGDWIDGTPLTVEHRDLNAVYNKYLGEESEQSTVPASTDAVASSSSSQPTSQSTKRRVVNNDPACSVMTTPLQLMMDGDIVATKGSFTLRDERGNYIDPPYPSQSEADCGLATLLAIKHEGCIEKIDADFRVSSLYRPKFDRGDYRDSTLKKALATYTKLRKQNKQLPLDELVEEDFSVVDEALPQFPRFTGSSAHDLAEALSPDIPYEFKAMVALACIGESRSDMDTLEVEPHTQPRTYLTLVAEPESGKTAAMQIVSGLLKDICRYKTIFSADSGPALVDAFAQVNKENLMQADVGSSISGLNAKIMLVADEATGLFEKSKQTVGSRNSLNALFLELYEGNACENNARSAKVKSQVTNAYLSWISGATPKGYTDMWTGSQGAAGGLQSRVMAIAVENYKSINAILRPADDEKVAAAILRIAAQMREPGARFEVTESAASLLQAWWSTQDQKASACTRITVFIKRLLIALARTNDVSEIDDKLMDQAIRFGEFVIACRKKYNPLDASTWVQMEENCIQAAFEKHGDMSMSKLLSIVKPERRSGGRGPFKQAFSIMNELGLLRIVGKNRQGAAIYRFVGGKQ